MPPAVETQSSKHWTARGVPGYLIDDSCPCPDHSMGTEPALKEFWKDEGKVYADELAELIRIWRRDLLNDKLPFIVIQIANFIRGGEGWPYIQQAQIDIQSKAPFVKTIISADVCEDDDIHPPTKHKLAERMTKCLLNE